MFKVTLGGAAFLQETKSLDRNSTRHSHTNTLIMPDASVKLTTSVCYNNFARCCFASLFRLFFSRLKLAIVFSLALTSVVSRSLSRKCSTKKHELKHHLKWFEFSCESRISRKTIERSFVVEKNNSIMSNKLRSPILQDDERFALMKVCLFVHNSTLRSSQRKLRRQKSH